MTKQYIAPLLAKPETVINESHIYDAFQSIYRTIINIIQKALRLDF